MLQEAALATTMDSNPLPDNEPPPSQSVNATNVKTFVDSESGALPVFVEATSVNNRPKLIRTLRNGGAEICHEPARARVILVDPHTMEGKKFVRDWSFDPGKVVLDSVWVQQCVNAGRLLLEPDGWGGCGGLDGGLSSDDEGNEEEIEQRGPLTSLPTPCPTPTGPVHSPRSQQYYTGPNYNANLKPQSPPAALSSPGQQEELQYPPSPEDESASRRDQSLQTPSSLLSSLIPASQASQLPIFATAQASAPGSTQFDPAIFNDPAFMQAAMSYYMTQIPGPPDPLHFTSPQSWPLQALEPMPLTPDISKAPNHKMEPRTKSSPGQPQVAQHRSNRVESTISHTVDILAGRIKSNSQHPGTPTPKKRRLDDQTPVSSSPGTAPTEQRIDYVGQSSTSDRSSSTAFASPSQPRSLDDTFSSTLFLTPKGRSMLFFVQVDIRERMQILMSIKKHGGKITSDIAIADFVILTSQGSSSAKLLDDATVAGKVALRAGFVQACTEAGAIVDEHEFILASPKARGHSGRPVKGKSTSSKQKPKSAPSGGIGPERNIVDVDRETSSSPTPPTKPVLGPNGKSAYTAEDNKYFVHCCRKAMQIEPQIGLQRLGKKIAEKATSHSEASWCSFIGRNKDKVEQMRREVCAELGVRLDGEQVDDNHRDEPKPHKRAKMEVQDPTDDMNKAIEADVARDLDVISNFFASHPNGDAEYLWSTLAQQHDCRTASSWPDFYTSHQDEVNKRV